MNLNNLGKRTICVMTKIDMAEKNNISTNRIEKLLTGKLFPMKAQSYFAVVAGKGAGNDEETIEDIISYEQSYLESSKFVQYILYL